MQDTTTTSNNPNAEVTLRDLYLVFIKHLPLILGLSLLLGLSVLLLNTFIPATYEAESTTIITPPNLSVQEMNGLSFTPRSSVSYETYRTLALSAPVLEATLLQFPELDLNVRRFRRSISADRLLGPPAIRPEVSEMVPLAVTHRVRHQNPELAAQLAAAWTEVTLDTIRNSVLSTLASVGEVTTTQIGSLRDTLNIAEDNWRIFNTENNLNLLAERVNRLNVRVAETELDISDIENSLAVSLARRQALQAQFEEERARISTTDPSSDDFLTGLTIGEAQARIGTQLGVAETSRNSTRAALDSFSERHNLVLINERVTDLNHKVAFKTSRIEEIPGEESRLLTRISNLEAQLAGQPQLLLLRDTLLANPTLSEVARQTDGLANLLDTQLETEVVNEVHTGILSALVDSQVLLEALRTERQVLEIEISVNLEQLEALRQEQITLQAQSDVLVLQFQRAHADYVNLLARAQQLGLATQTAADENRVLRERLSAGANIPPVIVLEERLREETVTVNSLQTELVVRRQNLTADQERLVSLQEQLSVLEQRRRELDLTLVNARNAYGEIVRLQPVTAYLTELAPAGARVLNRASVPSESVGSSNLMNSVLAFLVTFVLMTLFMFLREAVAAPKATFPATAQTAASTGD